MAGHFILTLDTTGPSIEIYSPTYATQSYPVNISIESNEEISNLSELYTIDSSNFRRDYILSTGGKYVNLDIDFSGYPLGITTIYAIASDYVDNKSSIYTKTIFIMNSFPINIEISDLCRQIDVGV